MLYRGAITQSSLLFYQAMFPEACRVRSTSFVSLYARVPVSDIPFQFSDSSTAIALSPS